MYPRFAWKKGELLVSHQVLTDPQRRLPHTRAEMQKSVQTVALQWKHAFVVR